MCVCKLHVLSERIDTDEFVFMDWKSYYRCHFVIVPRRCISISNLCLDLKLSFVRGLSKYKESILLTGYSVVYTSPCIWIPTGWNATLSSVSPCDFWTVRAYASLIGNCFWILSIPVFVDVDTGFDIHNIGVQSHVVFELYK